MEKAKLSAYQLFVLVLLFELGSAILVPLAIDVKQDAWLAILLGMAGGCFLFLIYLCLYYYYPNIPPAIYMQKIMGKAIGRALALLYILYFTYLASRVLRDFGEMLVTFAYPDTPMFIVNALLMMAIVYTISKGIEVLARAGELLFVLIYLLAITGFILIVVSGLIDINNLKPMLEEGISPVIKVVFTQTLYVPFGEAIAFTTILPYLNNPKKARVTAISSLWLSGINLALAMAINISVLGVDLASRSQFPLLSTIQSIQVADFLERLDVFFMLALIIGGFCKIGVYLYAAVSGAASLFNVKKPSKLVYPIGLVVLIVSLAIASNFAEHLKEGLQVVTILMHFPFQVIIPLLLLFIAFLKNRKKTG
ncbi:GerAB/ArcD/ProY family transporter [Fictibacillus gelatini]|uniref:GerAB/ArcD/ProY family transporter n=1 Tax=Fictibacillus gelatini TaxID=225985 RepID=UPI00041B36AF|nr:GerAB/ArcD/ProY family transporter [Fictibacillus gelatini]